MIEFLHQLASGLALGGVYAIMALALVMIYQATATREFRPRRDGDVLDLFRLEADRSRLALLARLRAHRRRLLPRRRRDRADRSCRPFANAPILASVIVFIGLALIFNALAGWLYGYSVTDFRPRSTARPWFGQRYMSAHELGSVLVSLRACSRWSTRFFRFTPLGLAMRAAAQNPTSSRLVGIRVGWMLAIGWGLAAAIGAVAGMMAAPIVYLDPNMMGGILLYAFAGAVLGGIDNPLGAAFGGFAVGVLENLIGRLCRRLGGQALGRAGHHRRRARLAPVRPVRPAHRGEGLTMTASTRPPADRLLHARLASRRGASPSRSSRPAIISINSRRC